MYFEPDEEYGTSLMVQWVNIYLPMQRPQVQSLVQEDPTCHGATKPVHHSPCAAATEACMPRHMLHSKKKPLQGEARALQLERRPCSLQLDKTHVQQRRPSVTRNK